MNPPADLFGLALQHHRTGDLQRAEHLYRRLLQHHAGHADAWDLLGVLASQQGQPDQALRHIDRALALRPDPAFHLNRGVALQALGRLPEAADSFRRAAEARPDWAEAHNNLANALCELGRREQAVAVLGQALKQHPGHAPLHSNLGEALSCRGQLLEAEACFREAVRLQPDFAAAHSNILIASAFNPRVAPDALLAEHRRWAEQHGGVLRLGPAADHDRSPGRRLRVGYVSGDFRSHVLARFVEPILAHHDPGQVEAVCYADVSAPDAVTTRLRSLASRWHSVCGRSDADVARLVRDDRLDILIDLGGHTGNRLGVFARQPAPVQVTYLGYPGTTGLDTVHYRLTDAVADPPGEPGHCTEELVRLPAGFCCHTPPESAPPVGPSPALSRGFVTFGSMHKLAKLNGEVLDLWCAVLRAVPSARLLVFRDSLRGGTRELFRQQFARRGIPEERVLLRHEPGPDGSFLGVYSDMDVLLDTFPWGGHATACEALWMGVPVLTLLGERHAGRMVASVLTRVGLADWIARTPEEFMQRAVDVAGYLDGLGALRGGLRERVRESPLCDGPGFTRHLEAAYREMWDRWLLSS